MEGLNYLCLGIYLCPLSLLLGVFVFTPLFVGSKVFISKKFGKKYGTIGIIISPVLALMVACIFFYSQFAPAFPDYHMPQQRPEANDLAGVWVLSPTALDLMDDREYPIGNNTLEFGENGQFAMTNLPDIAFFQNDKLFYSGNGTWKVKKDFQGAWQVRINLASLTSHSELIVFPYSQTPCPGGSVPCGGFEFSLIMWGRQPPYGLCFNIGIELDPDLCFSRLGDDKSN